MGASSTKSRGRRGQLIEFVRFRAHEDSAYQYQALIIRKDLELPVLAPLCDESKLTELEPRIDFGEYYPLVWRPIEKHLKGIHTIYYAPVGELYNVPFHAYFSSKGKRGATLFNGQIHAAPIDFNSIFGTWDERTSKKQDLPLQFPLWVE